MRKQRGYAFSQTDESQARVLQAYDTTRERGRYGEMASSRPAGNVGGGGALGSGIASQGAFSAAGSSR